MNRNVYKSLITSPYAILCMRYVCEVPGMILLQAYLRGVTYEVLPMSIHALSPMMLPPLETFLELMLWNSFQCCHIFLDVFSTLKSSSL